jgi:alpha-L-fucosidase 2
MMSGQWESEMSTNSENARNIVGRHKAVFVNPPRRVPSDTHLDGPLLGNGDVGVVLCGPPERLRFLISKNDFWKAKPGFPDGGPRPIGGIDLVTAALQGASYHVEVDLVHGELSGVFSRPGLTLELRAWVSATQNVLIVDAAVLSGSVEMDTALWVCSGDDSISAVRPDAEPATLSRRYAGPDLVWPCEAGVAVKRLGGGAGPRVIQAGQRVRLMAVVCSSFESNAPMADAIRRAEALDSEVLDALQSEHRRWWAEFWTESFVDIHDDVIERHYYGAQYLLACCCRNTGFPPGLWGNWITTDTPAWAGDYHLNYNHEAPFWGLYSSNHLQLADCYDTPLLQYIDAAKRNAEQLLGVRGIYCEVGIGPRGFCSSLFRPHESNPDTIRAAELDHGHQFWGQKSNALYGAVPMILRWHHTLDRDYARRVYPYLIEVANFWEDYLKFEDGRYVIHNDAYNEAGPWEGAGWEALREDFNPLISLGFLRLVIRGIREISAGLGCDAERRAKWTHILDHLSAFPLAERGGRLLPQAAEAGPSSRKIEATRITLHGTVWPGSVVGQDHMPGYYQVLREAVSTWGEEVWVRDGNAFDVVPPAAARLRLDPEHILDMMHRKIEAHALPNLLIEQGGGGIETCGGITAGINEMLLQSYEGVLRLFPCWPMKRDAQFANLRAWGAFLVSAELREGVVQGVRLVSEKGGDCTVMNPWPDREVRLVRNGTAAEMLAGDRLAFATAPGEEIVMEGSPQ